MIGTPGHGKDIVDTINACDKRYLKEEIYMVGTPEADDYKKSGCSCNDWRESI